MAKDIKQLTEEAMKLRKKYEQLETETYGRPWSNVELMSAFSADIGQLSKLIMIKEGLRKDSNFSNEKLSHELADCLWCILVLASKYNIDLEKSLTNMSEEMNNRLFNKD